MLEHEHWYAATAGSLIVADSDNHALREIELVGEDQGAASSGAAAPAGSPASGGRSRASVIGSALSRALLELGSASEQEERNEADDLLSQLEQRDSVAVRALWRQRHDAEEEERRSLGQHQRQLQL